MLGIIKPFLVYFIVLSLFACSSGGNEPQSSHTTSSQNTTTPANYSYQDIFQTPWNYSEEEIKSSYLSLIKDQYPGSFEPTEVSVEDLWEFYITLNGQAGFLNVVLPDIRNPRGRSQIINDWDSVEVADIPNYLIGNSVTQSSSSSQGASSNAEDICDFVESPVNFLIKGYTEDGTPIKGEMAKVMEEYVLDVDPFVSSGSHYENCDVQGTLVVGGKATTLPNYTSLEFSQCDHDTFLLNGSLLVGLFEFSGVSNQPGHLFGTLDSHFDIDYPLDHLSYRRGYFYNKFEQSFRPSGVCWQQSDDDFLSASEVGDKISTTGYVFEDKDVERNEVKGYANQIALYYSSEQYDWFLLQESSRLMAQSAYPDEQSGRIGLAEIGTLDFYWQAGSEDLPHPMINEIGRYTFIEADGDKAIFSWNDFGVIRILLDDGNSIIRGLYASPQSDNYGVLGAGRPIVSSAMIAPIDQLNHPPVLPRFINLEHDLALGVVAVDLSGKITDPDSDTALLKIGYSWFADDVLITGYHSESLPLGAFPVNSKTISVEISVSDGVNQVVRRVRNSVVDRLEEY